MGMLFFAMAFLLAATTSHAWSIALYRPSKAIHLPQKLVQYKFRNIHTAVYTKNSRDDDTNDQHQSNDSADRNDTPSLPPLPIVSSTSPTTAAKPKDAKLSSVAAFVAALKSNWLVIGEVFVILLAKFNPALGATGGILRPEFTISKLGVFTIFFINGVALSLSNTPSELSAATKTNTLIQVFNFGFIPLLFKLLAPFYPDPAFRDGLLVLACLPCTINICVAQTLAANGNLGTAIFNAIFANVLGVFLTPLLAIWMLGAGKGVSLLSTLRKLGGVVILPLILGQIVRRSPLGSFFQRISSKARTLSSCLLLAIVYNVFSDTFSSGLGVSGSSLLGLCISMPALYLALSFVFWHLSLYLLPGLDEKTRAAALLCSPQKTLAFGIPFIKTALGSRPDVACIVAPLLLYAPAQLLLGSSLLVPWLRDRIEKQDNYESGGGI